MKKVIFLVISIVVFAIGITTFAVTANKTISALLCYDVKIKYNGEYQTMYDANGTEVHPLNYNGTTYVPIRAISNMFKIPVNWDGDSRTVLLGSNSDWTYLTSENVSYPYNWYDKLLDVNVNGKKYDTGYKKVSEYQSYVFSAPTITFNNKYSDFHCIVISEVVDKEYNDYPLTIRICDEDTRKPLYEKEITADSINEIDANIKGYNKVYISISMGEKMFFPDGNTVTIVDMRAK